VAVPEDGDAAYFLRLARGVARDIRRGRLRPGDELPGSRSLGESLGVNRNTVVAAYRELTLEGWVVVRPGGGTFVAHDLPEVRARSFAAPADVIARAPLFALAPERAAAALPTPPAPGVIVMAGGVPDVRLLPADLLARAYRRVLASPRAKSLLTYGDPRGDHELRAAIAALAREARGVPASAEHVLVTRGSQMALDLVARAVVPAGGVVAVEGTGYRPAWAAFQRSGARVVPVPVDAQGIVVDAVAKLAGAGALSLLYVTPHHQYPTTVTLSPGRRTALLELARTARFAIVEDDYDHELHYDGRPVLPLASADARGSVVYVGTLSKVLAPGLRLGYVIAPTPLVERLARDRFVVDRQGDHVVERAAAELIADGTVARHVRKAKRIYQARRDVLVDLLERSFGGRVEVKRPSGGMALWVRVKGPDVAARWEQRALAEGVSFAAGQRFTFDGRSIPFARFGFAMVDEAEITEAVRRLEKAWPPEPRAG
jgi:GntR family transcriptional regulator/MocR family aminotransferase